MSRLFTPFAVKDMTLRNRIVMSPMCMYSADEQGHATDWHLVHYPARAVGGVGLVVVEATAVEARGRISDNDLGIWSETHVEGLARIVELVHHHGAKIGIQLAHAGRKGILKQDKIVAPSAIRFSEKHQMPEELAQEDIRDVVNAFQTGAQRSLQAGMDLIEIHAAHGYLLNQFLSPLSNQRTDEYGGSFEGRTRLLREVIRAVKEVWPQEKPLFIRLSCDDYAEGGLKIEDHVQIAAMAKEEGVDLIDCSSGGILPVPPSKEGPGYQVPFAEQIRREVGVPTAAVGLITEAVQAEEILLNERADLVFLARELLRHPYWPLEAARVLGEDLAYWPSQYLRAKC